MEDGLDYVAMRGVARALDDPEGAQRDIADMARRYEEPAEAARLIEVRFRPQQRVSFELDVTFVHEHWEG